MGGDGMAAKELLADKRTRKEVSELLCQHPAIRSQMRLLIKGVNDLSLQSNEEIMASTTLKEQLTCYHFLLIDFLEAMKLRDVQYENIEICNFIKPEEEFAVKYTEIIEQLDQVIFVVKNALYQNIYWEELNKYNIYCEELNRYIADIIKGVNRICKSIEIHMAEEERVLKEKLVRNPQDI